MIKLSAAEEQLMGYLWELEKAFMKDLLEIYPEPKPVSTTVSTLLKRMIDKGYVGYTVFGNSREYYPLVSKSDYFANHFDGVIKSFFSNSSSQFISFFTKQSDLSEIELEELKSIIDQEIKNKKR